MATLKVAEKKIKADFLSKRKGLMVINYSDGTVEVIKIKEGGGLHRRIIDKDNAMCYNNTAD